VLSRRLLDDSNPSSGTTQDVWDGYREHWTKEEACRVLEEAVVGFTGFVRKEGEGSNNVAGGGVAGSGLSNAFKPLLPIKETEDGTNNNTSGKHEKTSARPPPTTPKALSHSYPSPSSPPSPQPLYFHPQPSSLIGPTESFERTRTSISSTLPTATATDLHSQFLQNDALNASQRLLMPMYEHPAPSSFSRPATAGGWPESISKIPHAPNPEHTSFMDNFSFGPDGHSVAARSAEGMDTGGHDQGLGVPDSGMDSGMSSVLPQAEDGGASYTGSYWFVPPYPLHPLHP
jgi:hypothetical protein